MAISCFSQAITFTFCYKSTIIRVIEEQSSNLGLKIKSDSDHRYNQHNRGIYN